MRKVAELNPPPEHISAYSLIIEEGTPFYERYGAGEHEDELPDEEEERKMYRDTVSILKEFGYHRYEISNYAKDGYECRHNLGYWDRTEYLGIGAGAASLIENRRFTEVSRMGAVEEQVEPEVLSVQNQMEEYMFLGLRKIKGVSIHRFRELYGVSMQEMYGEVIERMINEELMEKQGDFLRLTEKGIDVSNYVMSEFLL